MALSLLMLERVADTETAEWAGLRDRSGFGGNFGKQVTLESRVHNFALTH